ncbi:SseB family protein [Nocardioides campestrisoli]|uniref:SseB family protein n=1 Tax=Nocardioides campestrisoli TaxID=2736757 RepID=UPI0015E78799|nr:SseB family protein [Nocardioides campestrisoli]
MADSPRFDGARILQTGFSGDTGEADPALAAALAAHDGSAATFAPVVAALAGARLLVPVVAVLGEVEVDEAGLAHDKSSDMAAVLLTGADGRTALLAFTSTENLARWNPEARPVPVTAETAALSAVQEGAAALVVDVAGPHPLALEGQELEAFAAGWQLVQVDDRWGWLRPADDSGDS